MRLADRLMQEQVELIGADVAGKPIFVFIERALAPHDLLALQAKYPRFTFVLATGATLPANDYYPSGFVRLLHPELDPNKERKCQTLMIEARANILPAS
jgi:hypothetical protein